MKKAKKKVSKKRRPTRTKLKVVPSGRLLTGGYGPCGADRWQANVAPELGLKQRKVTVPRCDYTTPEEVLAALENKVRSWIAATSVQQAAE